MAEFRRETYDSHLRSGPRWSGQPPLQIHEAPLIVPDSGRQWLVIDRLVSVRLFYSLLVNFSIFSALAHGAEWRLDAQFDRAALVRFTKDNEQAVAGPEPVVRWQGSASSVLKVASNTVKLALTPGGLTAVITKRPPGRFGELVFTVDVQNTGNGRITGTLLPPLSLWRDSSDAISSHSPEFVMLTSSVAEIGTLGVH